MGASLKCQYGLRALFELSRRYGEGLVCAGAEIGGQAFEVVHCYLLTGASSQAGAPLFNWLLLIGLRVSIG